MATVLITRDLPGNAAERLADAGHEARCGGEAGLTRDELLRQVRGVDALLSQLAERIDAEVLDAAGPQLRIVSNYAVGTNNVDIDACTKRGIWVGHTPDVLTEATADIAWALLLATARRVGEGERLIRSGEPWLWAPKMLLGADLVDKTLLIVGPGRIGAATARRAKGWRMKLLYAGRRGSALLEELGARKVSLSEGLARADIVSLHVPLTPQTRHLIGADELRHMKASALLINTARGPVVDEAMLVRALGEGWIRGAGLDVYEDEPVVHPGLLQLDNAVLLPHLGSATDATRHAMADIAVTNIMRALSGHRPLHAVNELA